MTSALPTLDDVAAAAARLRPHLEPTPLLESPVLGDGVLLKLETSQPTGSFKVRGALSALGLLPAGERVIAASAGNHALGVAHAAAVFGLDATVVCPQNASPAKLTALGRYPARLVRRGQSYDEAERHALALAAQGGRYVSPYNNPDVVAGGGTLAAELLAEVEGPMTIVCPVGGGGLISGIGLVASTRPDVQVVGVESEAGDSMRASLAAGRIVPVEQRATLADGLAGNLEPGSITFELVQRCVAGIVIVSEAEIEAAIRFCCAEHGLVVEGAAVTSVAAVLNGRLGAVEGRVVALLTGRNIDLPTLARVLGRT
jgi:threonine dehydratase